MCTLQTRAGPPGAATQGFRVLRARFAWSLFVWQEIPATSLTIRPEAGVAGGRGGADSWWSLAPAYDACRKKDGLKIAPVPLFKHSIRPHKCSKAIGQGLKPGPAEHDCRKIAVDRCCRCIDWLHSSLSSCGEPQLLRSCSSRLPLGHPETPKPLDYNLYTRDIRLMINILHYYGISDIFHIMGNAGSISSTRSCTYEAS